MPVQVRKPRGPFAPLAMRLILIKKPPQAAARARVAERHANRKDRRARLDPRTLVSADHMILLTSLPADAFPVERIGALYRLRCQSSSRSSD